MRLNVEQLKLQKSKVGTVVADSVDAVGPVVFLEVQIEGYPVKAVVDTGAQSTIISRDLLHRIAKYMRDAGREDPTLVHPSAKLYGRSGSDSSELTISAEVQFELSLDGHCMKVPVCLLGMNVLPRLGVQFLRRDGMPLTVEPYDVLGGHVRDGGEAISQSPGTTTHGPALTRSADSPDQSVVDGCLVAADSTAQAKVCVVHSTYIPPCTGRVLEVQLQSPFRQGDPVQFEPSLLEQMDGVEAPEVLTRQGNDGRLLIPVENYSALSARLEPGMCIGTATLIDDLPLVELDTAVVPDDPVNVMEACLPTCPEAANVSQCASQVDTDRATNRLDRLFEVLALERGTLTEEQFSDLKKMIADNSDVFALDDTELGHTDLVKYHVDTGSSAPIKQPIRRVPFFFRDKIAAMVDEMEGLGVI